MVGGLSALNAWISDPKLTSYLDQIQAPKTITVSLGILGIITWIAHGRETA